MNILFVLYGDFTTNTANPVILFTRELHRLGHHCVVAVPDNLVSVALHDVSSFKPILYEEVLGLEGRVFVNGERADVIHACTPRIGVSQFLEVYLVRWPSPLVIYLEDNEAWLSRDFLGLNQNQLYALTDDQISGLLPKSLAHPITYKFMIALADIVIIIQSKLQVEVLEFQQFRTIPWGVDQELFYPNLQPSEKWKKHFSIENHEKIIVYHGGLNGFTRPAMLDLCLAIGLINQSGISCKLIRTGANSINFWDELPLNAREYILDGGIMKKEELPSILALADIFVQPGRINPFEDLRLPSKLPEFLSMGRPVILPNVNIANLFRDGEDAILLKKGDCHEIADACLFLFRNKDKSAQLGRRSRAIAVQYFNLSDQTQSLLQAYIDAIAKFDRERTRKAWECLTSNGAREAALSWISSLIKDPIANVYLINKQLVRWFRDESARLSIMNPAVEERKVIQDQLLVKRLPARVHLILERVLRWLKKRIG